MEQPEMNCPFCGYKSDSEYRIMLHMETLHPEGGNSPFIIADDDASIAAMVSLANEDAQYTSCPVEGCGEAILFAELDSHIEMHGNEQTQDGSETEGEDDAEPALKKPKLSEDIQKAFGIKLSHALRNLDEEEKSSPSPPSDKQAKQKAQWKDLLKMPSEPSNSKTKAGPSPTVAPKSGRRLGKSELGPHANEKQMPSWVVKILEKDGMLETVNRLGPNNKLYKVRTCVNQASGILPVVAQLLEQDSHTEFVYLCHPAVKHISKLRGEGGFCGYRNIQMLSSYIVGVEQQGYDRLDNKIPSIFKIQDFIEHAWDLGINVQGRVETGGIRGTRKYIGTPDAQAMFCSLDISCDAQGIRPKKKGEGLLAYEMLFEVVQSYFMDGCTDFASKVRLTSLPPMYFQHPGHSMTIVGFEQKEDGSKNLIVFDPMFHDNANVLRLVGNENFKTKSPTDMLRAYRRGVKYLRKYNEFEILRLTPPESWKGNITKGTWD